MKKLFKNKTRSHELEFAADASLLLLVRENWTSKRTSDLCTKPGSQKVDNSYTSTHYNTLQKVDSEVTIAFNKIE